MKVILTKWLYEVIMVFNGQNAVSCCYTSLVWTHIPKEHQDASYAPAVCKMSKMSKVHLSWWMDQCICRHLLQRKSMNVPDPAILLVPLVPWGTCPQTSTGQCSNRIKRRNDRSYVQWSNTSKYLKENQCRKMQRPHTNKV